MQKNHFSLVKKLKNTASAQLWSVRFLVTIHNKRQTRLIVDEMNEMNVEVI